MNYCIAAFAIVLIVSIIQWFVDGRENYSGPKLDVEAMKTGEVQGLAPEPSNEENGVSGEDKSKTM